MGTWGAKNFENDTAGDFYLLFVERLIKDIKLAMLQSAQLYAGSYWSDVIPCIMEILTVLSKQEYHVSSLPEVKDIQRWKATYMDMWSTTIDQTRPQDEYRREREKVLNDTFDRFIAQAKKEE